MEAIRKIIHREGNTLTIELPDSFTAQTVELIILPADDAEAKPVKESPADDVDQQSLTDFQRYLLTWPTMSDDEYNDYLLKKTRLQRMDETICVDTTVLISHKRSNLQLVDL